jgi:hypothetical protein
MTPCLQPDELVDLVDGALAEERAAHLTECERCRIAAAELTATLAEIETVEVPEPSPWFWASMNRRVHAALAAQPAARFAWPAWLGWKAVVPLAVGAAALVIAATTLTRPTQDGPGKIVTAASSEPAPAPTGEPAEDALALVVDLANTLPDAGLEALALAPLPDLGVAAAGALTEDEQLALELILRAAVDRPKS